MAQMPTPEAGAVPAASATPYPVGFVAPQADSSLKDIAQIQASLGRDALIDGLSKFIEKLSAEAQKRKTWTDKILASTPRISVLQDEQEKWAGLRDDVVFRIDLLNAKLRELDQSSADLAETTRIWQATAQSLKETNAPADTIKRATLVLQQAAATDKEVNARRKELLGLQGRLVEQKSAIDAVLSSVETASRDAVSRLALRDSPPLWQAFSTQSTAETPIATALATQWAAVRTHVVAERGLILLQLTIWVLLLFVFHALRRQVRKLAAGNGDLRSSTAIFEAPGAIATLIALLASAPFHDNVTPLSTAVLDAAVLFPLLLIVRRTLPRPLFPITSALAFFYLTYQLREAIAPLPFIARLVYLVEVTGGIFFCLWLIKQKSVLGNPSQPLLWKSVQLGARVALLLFVFAEAANILGYLNLGQFVSNVTLACAYAALLFYAAAHILGGFVTFGLNTRPLNRLTMVQRHRPMLERRAFACLRFAAAVVWIAFALNKALLLQPLLTRAQIMLGLPLVAGVTLGGIITFLLTVWASFLISSFIRFLLEEDVYHRVKLKAGLPFAISTLIHYVILLLGFYLATAALVGDMTKFTILAGAFGVGIGFGLQNIVSNFISSIIVLFERPIKIGDLVQVGTQQGTVRRIGIRATIIRASDGSDVIIPNGKLISDPVTNWTLTSHQRQIQIEVATPAAGQDANKILALLEEAAASCDEVSKSPPPSVVLASFGANLLRFDIRAWTDERHDIRRARSSVAVAISQALAKNNIPTA